MGKNRAHLESNEFHSHENICLLAQGPSGPDLAPRTRKVPARRSPESSELMQFENWNHQEPLGA